MRLNRHFIRSIEGGTPAKTTRLFLLPMGENLIAFSMRVEPLPGTHTTPPEAARRPEDGEVLEAIERLFLGSLVAAPVEPDHERGWEAYRRELLETHGCRVPSWAELPEQVRECFAAGIAAAGGAGVPSDQWAGISGEKLARMRASMDVVLKAKGLPPVPDVLPEGCVELGFQKGSHFSEGDWVSPLHFHKGHGSFWGSWWRWNDPRLFDDRGDRNFITAKTRNAEERDEFRGPGEERPVVVASKNVLGLDFWPRDLIDWSLTGVEGFLRRRAGEEMQAWIDRLQVDGYYPVPHVAGSYVMKGPGLLYNREGLLVGRAEYGEHPPAPVPVWLATWWAEQAAKYPELSADFTVHHFRLHRSSFPNPQEVGIRIEATGYFEKTELERGAA